jgi:AraC-like DNA-binding protein
MRTGFPYGSPADFGMLITGAPYQFTAPAIRIVWRRLGNAIPISMNRIFCPPQATDIIANLSQSDLFLRYRDAFRQTTGRGLRFVEPPLGAHLAQKSPQAALLRIPVLLNRRTIGFLSLDPFRIADGTDGDFDSMIHRMLDEGASAARLRAARQSYDELPVVTPAVAAAITTLLEIFAVHLGDFAEKIFLRATGEEPPSVAKARHYILTHLGEPIALEAIAADSGMSACYFCRTFKKSTGLTFTEFLTRARIEEAKRLLLRPQSRVTEVAFHVGFQSLSQFNRSFKKVTSLSPTVFRCGNRATAMAAA